jgi:hypothetical protein
MRGRDVEVRVGRSRVRRQRMIRGRVCHCDGAMIRSDGVTLRGHGRARRPGDECRAYATAETLRARWAGHPTPIVRPPWCAASLWCWVLGAGCWVLWYAAACDGRMPVAASPRPRGVPSASGPAGPVSRSDRPGPGLAARTAPAGCGRRLAGGCGRVGGWRAGYPACPEARRPRPRAASAGRPADRHRRRNRRNPYQDGPVRKGSMTVTPPTGAVPIDTSASGAASSPMVSVTSRSGRREPALTRSIIGP